MTIYKLKWYNSTMFGFRRSSEAAQNRSSDLCMSCAAVCCRDMVLPLTDHEAQWQRDSGTHLRDIPDEITTGWRFPSGRKLYVMSGSCALLDQTTGLCNAYEDPARPAACAEFDAGSGACMEARAKRLSQPGPVPLPMPAIRAG